jgi:hypothetical protein
VAFARPLGAPTVGADKPRIIGHGVRPTARAYYEMPPERLAEMVADGWTLVEMAGEFGCHFSTVSLRLRRLGLR